MRVNRKQVNRWSGPVRMSGRVGSDLEGILSEVERSLRALTIHEEVDYLRERQLPVVPKSDPPAIL